MKFHLGIICSLCISSPALAAYKEINCLLIEGNSTDKVARVEYVRSTVFKSSSLAPKWDAHPEQVVYVDGCKKIASSYLCTNPVKDYEIEASFDGRFLHIKHVQALDDVYECR